ncbi:stage II sporulation protein AB (anti-sigma F factor) [Clostridium acetobutylicum]|uniref:Anti-sigma F factor n=1 Tax=Clostridium acetobutylicum (strain ATCC 824 / DSM 792 / JCM 1419 / IAM 19013 / LMG 5710 / NBRC 13948 / NRRL B-527 / VKM B-1787 / 2291 / W) TaxID=272562 RepID=SP2AB_CLOAB|nr:MULTISPECIES: anti-sigma F factor [Clostridium]Q97GQ9.1 RecName: Full=Anti-sigma F factor; AltName: Full=Stage II sporulation protein AB [Clostridium acetobutylicum ATCC 824]AAK80263.1 Sigma factor F inhibitor spoIIAB (anti-sigma factor) [Clostridium acetobutylicum ATCC 824]ADZ21359.1 anti-sigma F factor [Clostridium acetobutylicum EA 2018]AEI33773.1 anti-sigma F factor [Clostridium acetobutylicum DSM 1731]AWV79314.1 anti-sigma F factor [Clostridium acetobutylicum]KHD38445.1 anti-sigma F f
MLENKMELKFLAKSENESFARVTVASFASELDPTLEEIDDVKMAVSEAVTNAIIHGYENKGGVVTICAVIEDRELTIEVMDEGIGIENIEKAMEPLYTSRPDLERSGMGFTVMESFMDNIKVESEKGKGTKIIMKKKFALIED